MRILLVLLFFTSTASAQSLAERYQALSDADRQSYDLIAQQAQPILSGIEQSVRNTAQDGTLAKSKRLEVLSSLERQLEAWVGNTLLKYAIMLPLRNTVRANIESLAQDIVLKVPYQSHQIKSQFNINGAQAYAYGPGNLTLIRGNLEKGNFSRGEKVILYFKQGGPVITAIEEDVSNPGDTERAFLLSDYVAPVRFIGGAAMFIPQR